MVPTSERWRAKGGATTGETRACGSVGEAAEAAGVACDWGYGRTRDVSSRRSSIMSTSEELSSRGGVKVDRARAIVKETEGPDLGPRGEFR